jgi:hypothetical protein
MSLLYQLLTLRNIYSKTQRFENWVCFRFQVRSRRRLFSWVSQKELTQSQ